MYVMHIHTSTYAQIYAHSHTHININLSIYILYVNNEGNSLLLSSLINLISNLKQ